MQYQISTDADYWGEGYTESQRREMAAKLERLIVAQFPDVDVCIAPGTTNNRLEEAEILEFVNENWESCLV